MTSVRNVDQDKARTILAFVIIALSITGIAGVSFAIIWLADDRTRPEMARLVFASILPLLGTWVGTVLAFYFARENLRAATESTLDTLRAAGDGRLTPTTPVSAAMIPWAEIKPKQEALDKQGAGGLKLKFLSDRMTQEGRGRIPIVTMDRRALYVIHEPDIDKYSQLAGKTVGSLDGTDTINKMLDHDTLRTAIAAFESVGPTASLGDARTRMASSPECKDIFITESGVKDDPIIGWLTNSDLARVTG